MVEIRTETWAAIDEEIKQIAPLHFAELALDQLLFKPDFAHDKYLAMDRAGGMHVVTARDRERLIGYIVCFVMPHLHYQSSGLTALADMYFVLCQYRKGGLGLRMFREMERGLRERGVIRVHMSCKRHQDHTQLFEGMGYALTDYTFSKVIKCP